MSAKTGARSNARSISIITADLVWSNPFWIWISSGALPEPDSLFKGKGEGHAHIRVFC